MALNPLETIIEEMEGCVTAGFPLVSLFVAVAIPSICASLEMPDGRALGEEYKNWCRDNLYPGKGFDKISPEQLLSLRNGFTHQSRTELKNNKGGKLTDSGDYKRVEFIISQIISISNCENQGDAYGYSVREFCHNIGKAALEWAETKQGDQLFEENLSKIATYHGTQFMSSIY